MVSMARTMAVVAAAGIACAGLAAPVFAADSTVTATTAPATTTTMSPTRAHWEAVAGNFARVEEARELRARLAAHGLTDFRVEEDQANGRTWGQVERPFAVRANGAAEVVRLHTHGFRGWLEFDPAGVR